MADMKKVYDDLIIINLYSNQNYQGNQQNWAQFTSNL